MTLRVNNRGLEIVRNQEEGSPPSSPAIVDFFQRIIPVQAPPKMDRVGVNRFIWREPLTTAGPNADPLVGHRSPFLPALMMAVSLLLLWRVHVQMNRGAFLSVAIAPRASRLAGMKEGLFDQIRDQI